LPEREAAIAPATPARAAPEASSGTFAFCASGGTPFAVFFTESFTESVTPLDTGLDFDFAVDLAFPIAFLALVRDPFEPLLALVRDPFEPFDLGLEDRDPRELELDRRALDFDFVLAFV
jgi:hypothetical protein